MWRGYNTKSALVFEATQRKKYTVVYRVQNKEGIGPYGDEFIDLKKSPPDGKGQIDLKLTWMDKLHTTENGHPPLLTDKGFSQSDIELIERHVFSKHPYVFVFSTMEQLNRWFSQSELSRLSKYGFEVTKIKARRVWDSGIQSFCELYVDGQKLSNLPRPLNSSERLALEGKIMFIAYCARTIGYAFGTRDKPDYYRDAMKKYVEANGGTWASVKNIL